ncbi:MAG: hypothetical protein A2091_12335 [Desulfuromonadales bacterium GWD2_61_12]|nr:MAG: hypothetical protein A2005_10365 [Desulfuromonadales bacterium GWC2_61_20]OGR35851.1 MAG: hypothetical protein A2091_12335 [Desulfuromonadales bacterium GWD2_61_12]
MQAEVELLRELQDVDQSLNVGRRDRQKLEGELAEIAAEVERVQVMVASLATDLETLQGQKKVLNQALAQEQDNVQKAEGRLPAIKTQKEYVAVLKEIDTAKKVNKDLLDKIAAKDGEIEALSREKGEKDASFEAVSARVGVRRSEIESGLSACDKQLATASEQRETLLGRLPAPLRKRYVMLVERRGGTAIVPARKGTCLGCNMQLPPQLFNTLFTSQELLSCPHCNRLLYLHQE